MKEMYFTIAGCNHYYGSDFMEKGMKVKLVKEPDNEYDNEAIQVKIKGFGKVGYVANSPYTVKAPKLRRQATMLKNSAFTGGTLCQCTRPGACQNSSGHQCKCDEEETRHAELHQV